MSELDDLRVCKSCGHRGTGYTSAAEAAEAIGADPEACHTQIADWTKLDERPEAEPAGPLFPYPNVYDDLERDKVSAPAFSVLWLIADDRNKERLKHAYCEVYAAGESSGSAAVRREFNLVREKNLILVWPPEGEPGAPSLCDQGMPELDEVRICKVKTQGKWIEFWLGDADLKGRYTQCCKHYMLDEVIDREELWDRVTNHGFVGLIVTWPKGSDRPTGLRIAKYK